MASRTPRPPQNKIKNNSWINNCFVSKTQRRSIISHLNCLARPVASRVVLNHSSASKSASYSNPRQSGCRLCLLHLGQSEALRYISPALSAANSYTMGTTQGVLVGGKAIQFKLFWLFSSFRGVGTFLRPLAVKVFLCLSLISRSRWERGWMELL